MTSILSQLIMETGKNCKAYASDLVYGYDRIRDTVRSLDTMIELTDSGQPERIWFGIRDYGVDGEMLLFARLDGPSLEVAMERYYNRIYLLEISVSGDHERQNGSDREWVFPTELILKKVWDGTDSLKTE